MPGNDVGDRVHNFLDQGSLSQDQRHTQLVGANWPLFDNNIWNASERQIGGPLNSGSVNYSAGQSDIERGQGNQFSPSPHGVNFTRPSLRPEFSKSPSQLQQLNLNGFMHASQVGHTRQNEGKFLGVDTEPDRYNMTRRSPSVLESHQRSSSQHSNVASFGGLESPMNFNFLGGQQQINGQQPGMLQSFPRQQPVNNDTQLQQQIMLKQMQELQRHHQLQQLEAMQRSATNNILSFGNSAAGHPQTVNGNPMRDTSNPIWPPQAMGHNTNWQQRGLSSSQGYSNGFMNTPDQGHAMQFMGLIPQQNSQSLYGVPVSSSRSANAFFQSNMDKPGMLQVPTPSSSFSGNQYSSVGEQVNAKDGNMVSKYGSEGRSAYEQASSQCLANVNLGGFTKAQQRNVPISKAGGQGLGSELFPEKPVTQSSSQSASAQTANGLDPTEEKILFGNDENTSIWEAFGEASLTGSGDASDLPSSIPSLQGGTWTALMQSAVAETSSTDAGMQDDWSVLGSQNSRLQSGDQHPSVIDSNETSQLNFVDSSQRSSLGSQLGTNNVSTHDAILNTNRMNSSMKQQPFLNQRKEYQQTESPHEGRKWVDSSQHKSHVEEKHMRGNSNSSRDCLGTDAGFWSHQQNTFLPDNNVQQSNRPSPSDFFGSAPTNGALASSNQNNLPDKDHNFKMYMDTGHGSASRLEPVPNSGMKMGSGHFISKDDAVAPGLSNMKINFESSKLHNDDHHDLWKSVNSSGNYGLQSCSRDHHNLNKRPPILESSHNSPDGGAVEMRETENSDRRESSSDSHRNSFPQSASIGGLRENMWSDYADGRNLPGGQESSSSQSAKRGPVEQKFQYHPVADVNMDLDSYAAKNVLHSQSMSQKLSTGVKGQELNPRFLSSLNTNVTDMEKGRVFFNGPVNASRGVSSGGVHPGYLPNMSASFITCSGLSSPNQHISSSQNMLELFDKVDQSKEQNTASQSRLNSTDYNRFSEISAGGLAGPGQGQCFSSHGFGLQLAPPSQGIAPSNLSNAVQSSSRTAESPSSDHVPIEKGDETYPWLASTSGSSAHCLPPHQPTQLGSGNECGRIENKGSDVLASNFKENISDSFSSVPNMRSPLQNQLWTAPGGNTTSDQSATVSFNRHSYHDQSNELQPSAMTNQSVCNPQNNVVSGRDINQPGLSDLTRQMPVSLHSDMFGMPRKDSLPPLGSNLWTSQQQLLGSAACKAPEIKSQFQLSDASKTSSSQPMKDGKDVPNRVDAFSSLVTVGGESETEALSSVKTFDTSQEEPSMRRLRSASPSSSAINQKGIEPYHNFARPYNNAHNSYFLPHQMQNIRNVASDPSHQESKRLKGQDDDLNRQQVAEQLEGPVTGSMNSMVSEPSMNQTTVSAEDAKVLGFSPHLGNRNNSFQLPHGTVASQDLFSIGHSDPQKFGSGKIPRQSEETGISPPTGPSWFEQYGTVKHGQLLRGHNVPRLPMVRNVEQQFISGKSPKNLAMHNSAQSTATVTDAGQIVNSCQAVNACIPSERVSSLHALVPHVSATCSESAAPKKRKTATSALLPWNKEIEYCLKRLQNISSAEVDWAQSSNRLIEKVEDGTDNSEDLLPTIRPKRRLLKTTQLMQQVFQTPSAGVLSLDASSNYEAIIYSLSRSVLGDACSLTCVDGNTPVESGNLLCGEVQTSQRIRDQYFTKAVEDFVSREKELENDILRLDKRASILDIRLETQDLERFSVNYRFERFHGRGQVEWAQTSSPLDAAVTFLKPCPLRYVSARPMPRNVPEGVECLSL
ncbi:unnamed protein product [Amaranthus hypochondriacus]